ncbi:MAG: sigma-70 family RNA polymerase sigma factor, partial [Lachnospiraceae bacterium]|nr:sigma-70 family RNA polymerase sigma factor [Lachnospiraceae bacterium]
KSDLEWKEALAILGEEYRLPVVLYYVQGFQTKEIAKILGISDAAVRTRLTRAREQLRKYYGEA